LTVLAAGACAGMAPFAGAQPVMIDLNQYSTTSADASPINFAKIQTPGGERVVFSANDGTNGTELWITDGTNAGTTLLKDINAGSGASSPQNLIAFGSRVVFTAIDVANGRELWITDGTNAGTTLVRDITPGTTGTIFSSASGAIGTFGAPNSYVVFGANLAATGTEPWTTDGSNAGTVTLGDLRPGTTGSNASGFFADGASRVYFLANDGGAFGNELWYTDGTVPGTIRGTDIAPGSLSSGFSVDAIRAGWAYGGAVNSASTGDNEPTAVNLTTFAARRLADLAAGTGGSTSQEFVVLGADVYFRATAGGDTQLYRVTYDGLGDPIGAVLVANINAGGNDNVANLAAYAGSLYFSATDGLNGRELWKFDGVNPPSQVIDINVGAGDSAPFGLIVANGKLFFSATTPDFGRELYSSDGTALGTSRLADLRLAQSSALTTSPQQVVYNNTVLFSASGTSVGIELYSSDGTGANTSLVKDIRAQTGNAASSPQTLTAAGGLVYFSATDEATGRELWASDGTALGSVRVQDTQPGSTGGAPYSLAAFGSDLLFAANNGTGAGQTGIEYYRATGTTATLLADINPGTGSSAPGGSPTIGQLSGTAYFSATDGSSGFELWRYDGVNPPSRVADANPGSGGISPANFATLGSNLYFSAGFGTAGGFGTELYRSDGTVVVNVEDYNGGASNSALPAALFPFGGNLFMRATQSGSTGSELAVYVPTLPDMYEVQDIRVGSGSSSPNNFVDFNGQLHFLATDGLTNLQLYTATASAGSAVVKSAAIGSTGTTLVKSGSFLYFAQGTLIGPNVELWAYDGVANGGNAFAIEINPSGGSFPTSLTDVNGTLYFAAVGATGGNELYKVTIDPGTGLPNGAMLVADLNPTGSSSPANLLYANGILYFTADNGASGVELWVLPISQCDSIDFNGDGIFPDNQDLIDFIDVFAGGTCPTGTCNDIDFNNDGIFPDNQDLITLIDVLAGGSC
jgi:ELWxxDGT repeat protein